MKTEVTVTLVLTKEEFSALRAFLEMFCTSDVAKTVSSQDVQPVMRVITAVKSIRIAE